MTLLLLLFIGGALVTPFLVRRFGRRAFAIIAALPAATAIWTAFQAPKILGGQVAVETTEWIPTLEVGFNFRMDALAWSMAMLVSVVGALVLLYCTWYFKNSEPGLSRFAVLLLTFAGVMFGLVTADDIIVMFVFWEATSVLSYLLIGHVTGRRESRGAALQALLVTTFGGLAMLVGIVILIVQTGTTSIALMVAEPPVLTTPLIITAIMLVLVGAISKSALVPFHFWLPAAMAAPTPVSAYLHAAAMVKAGIYLIARFAPGYADVPGWRASLVTLGVVTMVIGGWRSMRQFDLKLVLAYGTVSQLGFLTLVLAFGDADIALAGMTLLIAHAAFKATLFLGVGMVDQATGTRDLRELSGLRRSMPGLAIVTVLAAASMAGLPPLLGFVAKEAVFTTLLAETAEQPLWAWVALIGAIVGSVLTVGYSLRYVWGAFADKAGVEPTPVVRSSRAMLIAPASLALFGFIAGLAPAFLESLLTPYVDSYGYPHEYHLSLWHGWVPALGITIVVVALGLLLFLARGPVMKAYSKLPRAVEASRGYWAAIRGIDWMGLKITHSMQSRGLPGYVSIILVVFVGAVTIVLVDRGVPQLNPIAWDYPMQAVIGGITAVAAIASALVGHRFAAVLLVGMAGYGLVALFGLHGAPDLALTQALVETVTLVVFVLVLRRLPQRIAQRNKPKHRPSRAMLGIFVGLTMAFVAVAALGARTEEPVSGPLPEMALEQGHGQNVVNVILVDIRAWDTLGEISMLVVVATGVASLLFVVSREGSVPRLSRRGNSSVRQRSFGASAVSEPVSDGTVTEIGDTSFDVLGGASADFSAGDDRAPTRRSWLLAGRTLTPATRSIMLEVLVRFLFHPAMVTSVFLLFVGHNAPGGGFAGGLLAGLALVIRYLAGGRYELGEAAPIDPGKLLGGGILLAAGTAASSMFFGKAVFESTWFEAQWGPFAISAGTSTLFDIGVYLVVLGVVLDILRSLGAQVDRHQDELEAAAGGKSS